MIAVLVFIVATVASAQGAFSPVIGSQLDSFVTGFRQTLLEKIAVETNSTVIASEKLKAQMENECKPKLQAAIAKCKLCASEKCKKAPSFSDLLKLADPTQYLKGPLDNIASKIGEAKDLLGIKIAPFVNSMTQLGAAIPDAMKSAFEKMKAGLASVYKALHLDNIGNIATNIGKLIADDLNDLANTMKGWFTGRRRRSTSDIDPEVRECMGQCADCKPLLLSTDALIIAGVCGQEIVDLNATLIAQMDKITNVYNHLVDKVNTIVSGLKIDLTTMVNFELPDVHITWYMNGAYKDHKASEPVPFMDMSTNLALEYWKNFPLIPHV